MGVQLVAGDVRGISESSLTMDGDGLEIRRGAEEMEREKRRERRLYLLFFFVCLMCLTYTCPSVALVSDGMRMVVYFFSSAFICASDTPACL